MNRSGENPSVKDIYDISIYETIGLIRKINNFDFYEMVTNLVYILALIHKFNSLFNENWKSKILNNPKDLDLSLKISGVTYLFIRQD